MIIDSQDHGRASRIQIEQVRTRLRVSLIERTEKDENTAERYQRRIWEGQVETLRNATHHAPYPIWQSDHDGRILWANTAYEDLITACGHSFEIQDGARSLPPVFDLPASPTLHRHRYRTRRPPPPPPLHHHGAGRAQRKEAAAERMISLPGSYRPLLRRCSVAPFSILYPHVYT